MLPLHGAASRGRRVSRLGIRRGARSDRASRPLLDSRRETRWSSSMSRSRSAARRAAVEAPRSAERQTPDRTRGGELSALGGFRNAASRIARQISFARTRSRSPNAPHIATRPSMAFHGSMQVAVAEAKTMVEQGYRVAFFAPSNGELERLADILREYSVPFQLGPRAERSRVALSGRARLSGRPGRAAPI